MIVLGIESSTPVASVALVSQEGLRGEFTLNIGLTHSEQLLPLVDSLLSHARTTLQQVEGLAVSAGPGSFTGLRIGMATAKGLAQGLGIPLMGVPTLQAMAWNRAGERGLISPVMNARMGEVYTALFRFDGDNEEQLEPFHAVSPPQWAQTLAGYGEPVLLMGDGAGIYAEDWQKVLGEGARFLPWHVPANGAGSVAWLGRNKLLQGHKDDLYDLKPVYIRSADAQIKLGKRSDNNGVGKGIQPKAHADR